MVFPPFLNKKCNLLTGIALNLSFLGQYGQLTIFMILIQTYQNFVFTFVSLMQYIDLSSPALISFLTVLFLMLLNLGLFYFCFEYFIISVQKCYWFLYAQFVT